jgi:hypothetical protein
MDPIHNNTSQPSIASLQAQKQAQEQAQYQLLLQHLHQLQQQLGHAPTPVQHQMTRKELEAYVFQLHMQRMSQENAKKRALLAQTSPSSYEDGSSSTTTSSSTGGEGQQAASASGSQSKRRRTDQAQYAILEEVFLKDPLPSRKTKEKLGAELGLSTRRVQVWFQNRRAKERRQLREMGINDSDVLPNPWGE